ncbi:MAG: alpha/beta hydrolase [Planctomycetota bacterium]|jgi:poly(3-hydroxybutyrate) depolymerase
MSRAARLVLLLCVAAAVQAGPDAETKQKAKLARVWIDFARWCKLKGLKTEAGQALTRARAADPQAKDLDRLAQEVEALEGDADSDPGLAVRRRKAHADAAKVYDRLAKLDETYLVEAARLDPSKTRLRKISALVKQLSGNRKNATKAGLLLVRLRELDPEGKYDTLESELGRKDVALIKHPDHPMVGFLSLPRSRKKGAKTPVLVTVDGAGSNFLGSARRFAKTRGSRSFLVLAPCSLSNTNELSPKKYPYYSKETLEANNRNRIAFDLEGLARLLEVLAERYGAEERVGITGFSGGGNLCYAWTAVHPDRIRFAAPACANFGGMGFADAQPVDDGGPPVHILTGANDPHRDYTHGNKNSPGIEPQTDNVMAALERLGFKHVRRTKLPGVGHSNCAERVWKCGDEVGR